MSAITAGWLYVGWGAPLFETYYGLMQHSPSEIKERLLKALDKEYNVVDMAAVLEIVSILERTPITKEALETTRLGRDINELRRKTKNESLAKRAKELVKRWRDLILKQSEAEASQQNGGRAVKRPTVSPATSVANSDRSSPGLPEAVPRTHASNKRLRKAHQEPVLVNGGSPEASEPNATPVPTTTAPSSIKRDIVKEKIASIARVAKVKTTQELVAGLRGDKPVASADLAKNKTEHIARFLRSEPEEEDTQVDVLDDTPVASVQSHPRFTPPDEILARLPPLDTSAIVWSDSEPSSPPEPPSPDSMIDRHINGVNGNLADTSNPDSFVEFHQVLTRTLQNGDIIHILPYVVID